ncbi:hypothetical protein [Lacipirellula sp.]|uniref:hypothetical protein n=1 Tax=Lacipirellula sp. TaxID=2691419 RepID=UPI003D124E5E
MPRPRFTLRVALVVTAIVSAIAWQGGIAWQRKAAMRDSQHTFMVDRYIPGANGSGRLRVNVIRKAWGDEPVRLIYMVPDSNWEAEEERLRGLFPEAAIEVMHPLLETPFPN